MQTAIERGGEPAGVHIRRLIFEKVLAADKKQAIYIYVYTQPDTGKKNSVESRGRDR